MYNDKDAFTQPHAQDFIAAMGRHAHFAWPLAMVAVSEGTGRSMEEVGTFLDSRWGGRFARHVLSQMDAGQTLADALQSAVQVGMKWVVSARTAAAEGVPPGMPYLVALVAHAARMETDGPASAADAAGG